MPKFAANLTWMFTDYEFLDRFAVARRCGFEAVECQFPYDFDSDLLKSKLNENNLKLVMFNMPPGNSSAGEYGLAGLPGRDSEFRDSVELALEYATALQCAKLHVLAGIVPNKASRQTYLDTYVENLQWAADVCGQSGVGLLLEPINTFERPGYLTTTTAQAREAIERIAKPNVFIQFDFHNAQLMEGNLTAALENNIELIGHMQIAGVPGRTPPDQGEMNYSYLFGLVDKLGYEGWLGCEYRAKNSGQEELGWAKAYGIGS